MIVLIFIFSIIAPIGPLSLSGMDPAHKTFYFNSTEIHYVDHTNSGDLTVFAFCSEQGELFHAVLYQSEPLIKLVSIYELTYIHSCVQFQINKNIFQLNVMDSMQIEDWPLKNMNVVMRSSK
jgi:hypothetical protein